MRLLIQRVKQAKVTVDQKEVGAIGRGLLLFLGIHKADTKENSDYLVKKVLSMRIFPDAEDKMNLDIAAIGGEIALVSQFTLYGDLTAGRRPGFAEAASPLEARLLYDYFLSELTRQFPRKVATGIFGAKMEVELINEGPLTFWLEQP